MNRLPLLAISILCLLLGLFVGWYVGHTRAVAKVEQMVRKDQESIRDHFHETEDQDEYAAYVACGVFAGLEKTGDVEKAKQRLATVISIYYHAHHADGNSNLIWHIERYAATNAVISNAIYRQLDSK